MYKLITAFCLFSHAAIAGCIPNYTPIPGDNSAPLMAALATGPVCLPAATIGLGAGIALPSGADLEGQGPVSVLQMLPGSPVTSMLANWGPISNIRIANLTIDGNSSTQLGQGYPIGLSSVSGALFDSIRIINPYGCAFWINGPDPGTPPDGIQINSNITIRNSVIDGTNQHPSTRNADLVVLGRTNGSTFHNNTITGGGANQLAWQFNKNFAITSNTLRQCWRCIYMETNQRGVIYDNDIAIAGVPAPQIGDAQLVGMWLTDAGLSYGGTDYSSPKDVTIFSNRIHDFTRSGGTTGIVGILVSGMINLPAERIAIDGNAISAFSNGSGQNIGVAIQGDVRTASIWNNTVTGVSMGYFPIGGAYAGIARQWDVALMNNYAAGSTWAMYSVNGSGNAKNFSSIGNNFPLSLNTYSGGYDVGVTTMPGFLAGHNVGF